MFPNNRKLSAIGLNKIEITSSQPTAKKITIMRILTIPEVSPFGPNKCFRNPPTPFAWIAQTNHITKKMADIAVVMFKSALPPRSNGRSTWKFPEGS